MGPEEILYVDYNLAELIKHTSCSVALISQLVSVDVLSEEEKQELQKDLTPMAKSDKLYQILKTRENGFHAVTKALENTKQSEAMKILLNFNKKYKYYGSISVDKTLLLGKSRYSSVHQGMFAGRKVAIKGLNYDYMKPNKAMKEIELLIKLDHHQNIVRYYNAEETGGHIYIALELCCTNLHNWVTKERMVEITETNVLRQSTCGISFLHQCNIIHRDLKPANILINSQAQVKISDFGISKEIPVGLSGVSVHSSELGTLDWMSPEALNNLDGGNSKKLTLAMDTFSLGCIFYFVLCEGKHPFGTGVRIPANILDDNPVHLSSTRTLSDDVMNLIKIMISYNHKERPSAGFVLHNLLTEGALELQQGIKQSNPKAITTALKNTILSSRGDEFEVFQNDLEVSKQSEVWNNSKRYVCCRSIFVDKTLLLGRGCYNTIVFQGVFEGREVAVKILCCNVVKPDVVMKEIELLIKLDHHPNIVRYLNAEETNEYIYIALELCSTNLYTWVTGERAVNITEMEILKQSACGIAFLHQSNIIHRALKPENIVINIQAQVKITDYGISKGRRERLISICSLYSSEFGTEGWISSEVLRNELGNAFNAHTAATDIFSLGCIFFFVLSKGKHPFGNALRREINILYNKQPDLSSSVLIPSYMTKLIKRMISHRSELRPSAKFVLDQF